MLLLVPFTAGSGCELTTSEPEIDINAAGIARFYGDHDVAVMDLAVFSLWMYQEANGVEGLQRADEVRDDTCGGRWPGDRIVF